MKLVTGRDLRRTLSRRVPALTDRWVSLRVGGFTAPSGVRCAVGRLRRPCGQSGARQMPYDDAGEQFAAGLIRRVEARHRWDYPDPAPRADRPTPAAEPPVRIVMPCRRRCGRETHRRPAPVSIAVARPRCRRRLGRVECAHRPDGPEMVPAPIRSREENSSRPSSVRARHDISPRWRWRRWRSGLSRLSAAHRVRCGELMVNRGLVAACRTMVHGAGCAGSCMSRVPGGGPPDSPAIRTRQSVPLISAPALRFRRVGARPAPVQP